MSSGGPQFSGSFFPTTQWTAILDSLADGAACAEAASERLCKAYWPPVNLYFLKRGFEHHEAEDMTQDFFIALLKRDAFAELRRENGRFRSFLVACLKNFIANRYRGALAQKRGGGAVHQPLDESNERFAVTHITAETEFHRKWAATLLDSAIAKVAAEYEASGKKNQFLVMRELLPGGRPSGSGEELAASLGMTSGAFYTANSRMRARIGETLRELVACTVERPEDVDAELKDLIALLIG